MVDTKLGVHHLDYLWQVLFALAFTVARMIIGPFIVAATLAADSPVAVKVCF